MKLEIRFREGCQPAYMTPLSSHCDLFSAEDAMIPAGEVRGVPTGVWIESFVQHDLGAGIRAELQIRCRSSLPIKRQLMLANGIGTIDLDFPDEIQVLLYNFGKADCSIARGERIGQMSLSTVLTIAGAKGADQTRIGGFGSTGRF